MGFASIADLPFAVKAKKCLPTNRPIYKVERLSDRLFMVAK